MISTNQRMLLLILLLSPGLVQAQPIPSAVDQQESIGEVRPDVQDWQLEDVPAKPKRPKGAGGGPGGGAPGYSATWYPNSPVVGQNSDFGVVRQSLNAGVPLWHNGGDLLLVTAGVKHSLFITDARLPDTNRPFPGELWNINVGLNFMHEFENGWSGGLITGFGSASDKPFHSIHEMNVNLLAFLRVPTQNDRDFWMFSLMYMPAGNLNFPIPGVAYAWNPSDTFHMNIGLPFSINWQPMENLTFDAMYIPLTNVNARVNYRITTTFAIYTGYEFLNEAYFLSDRINNRDRFMAFEQRLISGLQLELSEHIKLDLNGGYVFDRRYGEGQNQGGSLTDRVNIEPGAFLGASLRMGF